MFKKGKIDVVVVKKGVGVKGGKGRIVVDRCLRKDFWVKNIGKFGWGFKGRGGGFKGVKVKVNKSKGLVRGGKGWKL